jgi:hypothetical protein
MPEFLELLRSPWGVPILYLLTIAIETPILCVGLSAEHPMSRRILCGIWLTACTYPLVGLVVPYWFDRAAYLLVAESIAHFGECALFYFAFTPKAHPWRDLGVIFLANLASFGTGELLWMWLI